MADMQQTIAEFERSRAQLLGISAQKQQLQAQSESLQGALEELKKTKEAKVYKAVGPILILAEVKEVEKDVSTQKESVDLRFKTVQRQEDAMIAKLNKLRAEIEKSQGKQEAPSQETGTLAQ